MRQALVELGSEPPSDMHRVRDASLAYASLKRQHVQQLELQRFRVPLDTVLAGLDTTGLFDEVRDACAQDGFLDRASLAKLNRVIRSCIVHTHESSAAALQSPVHDVPGTKV